MYKRDVGRMRDDNVADYIWLLTSLKILMRGYGRLQDLEVEVPEREDIVEGILNGLTPDPWAFLGKPPSFLSAYQAEHGEFLESFDTYKHELMDGFARHRPTKESFSPLNFHFSFPHNAMVALVMVALKDGLALDKPLDALFTRGSTTDSPVRSCSALAQRLMDYSASRAAGLDDPGPLLVVHDPMAGLRHYNMTMSTIRKHFPATA